MEDDLTWLALNVHEWPAGDTFIGRILKDGEFAVASVAGIPTSFVNWFTIDQWIDRRSKMQNKPSWKDAPEWANWLCQRDDGMWFWCVEEPRSSEDGWETKHEARAAYPSGDQIPEYVLGDWRDTLERRPVDLSEPAGGVKERSADGAEELNAMARRLLVALKSDPRSFDTGALAEMVELADAEIVKRDAAVCGGEGYLNNHWFERGELPPIGEFVDVEGEDLVYGNGELSCEVIAHVEDTAVIRMSYGLGCFQKHVLSPSRTERDKAIDEMKQHCPHHGSWDAVGRIYAEALYDAGYRKQISPAK
ncbi:hypothetical protein CF142_06370 [Aeromonas caviae]|uniref:hypothetical protein n=1 Tax=Aeromonas TaxID=642 RepID=UPI0005B49FF3|nr:MULTISPECIES: hypothetical protein [Aeromonas]TNH75411.1 hypothetical protein CF142_06370 [Aeromonas caviae]